MAAPTATVRQTPVGTQLDDGFSTKIAFALDPTVELWERAVKPPGAEGGDGIETTTMHQDDWRTESPRGLADLGPGETAVAYDPAAYTAILALLNRAGAVTVHFPDGATLSFWGFLRKFEPQEDKEGEFPEATAEVVPTNYDPAAHGEEPPVLAQTVYLTGDGGDTLTTDGGDPLIL